ncbi:type II secretion system minor pseudopilin GspK [Colwellia sp. E2M01]|uniref:type II secretion system minor pseudopilin GspK n=1 Tax=Colwellia sp. E2M01 TaxID=2841561 RepID=UPI0020915DD3|nr:type II secretion system minor pseudopilin GspK [Colwellia sp. E2M01]
MKQQGVALITVMLIVALASIIAAQMTARLQMQMQRGTNISFNQQAYWYALGAEAFAKRVLIDAFKDEPSITHLEQNWAIGANSYPVDFGDIGGELSDLQACLNLNALHPSAKTKNQNDSTNTVGQNTDLPAATILEALILNLNIEDVSNFEAEAMVQALTDWLDDNDRITGSGGAEDNDYASREYPYLAANNYLGSLNELRLVEHFTPEIILVLEPYVCVLPNNSQNLININTLSAEQPELIQAIFDISIEDAQSVLNARESSGYEDLNDFFSLPELSDGKVEDWQKEVFVVDSDYFKLKANARFNNSYFDMNSIMQVTKNQEIQIISRTIGRN